MSIGFLANVTGVTSSFCCRILNGFDGGTGEDK
jgi:hypothetical protein